MFLIRRPDRDAFDLFVRKSQDLPLSYNPPGIVRTASARRGIVEARVAVGRGPRDFERARAALLAWRQFDIGWIETFPKRAPVEVGSVVAVLIRHLGFWSLNGCRVVYCVGSREEGASFGFAYGTLTNHAEAGEELFEVFIDARTEDVMYRIRATSWPRTTLTLVGHPIVRALQARFRRDSAAAMTLAIGRPLPVS